MAMVMLVVLEGSGKAAARTTGAAFLSQSVSARAAAMGDANTAWADDVYGMWFNPAGIATVPRQEVGFQYNSYALDMSHNFLGYLHPFSRSALAVSLQYVDLGSIERTTVLNGAAVRAGNASANDLALGVTYARTMGRSVDLGVTAKVISEHLDNFSATAVAVDLGAKWRVPVDGLTVGISLRNLGSSMRFVQQDEVLPLSLRLGAGYRSSNERWGIATDLDFTRGQNMGGHVGGEYWVWDHHLALRGGFTRAAGDGSGVTLGSAFRWQDLQLDYAYRPSGVIGDQHQVGLTYEFGAAVKAEGSLTAAPASSSPPVRSARPAVDAIRQNRVHVEPFAMRVADPPGTAWLADATTTVMRQAIAHGQPLGDNGRYWLTGDCIAVDGRFFLTANLNTPTRRIALSAEGSPDLPYAVWESLCGKLNQELGAECFRLKGRGRP